LAKVFAVSMLGGVEERQVGTYRSASR